MIPVLEGGMTLPCARPTSSGSGRSAPCHGADEAVSEQDVGDAEVHARVGDRRGLQALARDVLEVRAQVVREGACDVGKRLVLEHALGGRETADHDGRSVGGGEAKDEKGGWDELVELWWVSFVRRAGGG